MPRAAEYRLIDERVPHMMETVINTNTLPDFLLGIIPTEKVHIKEIDGMIQLTPVKDEARKEARPIKRPISEFIGLLEGKIWMSDDFDEPLEEMKEYME